jgi:lipid-A-disaccharide synthase
MTASPLRVFAGAGEASGDRILAALLRGLREARGDTGIEARGFGGPLSEAQGLHSLYPLRDLAVNGFFDVIRRGVFLARAYARLRRALVDFSPDLVLLVDYPGMNLGLARLALRRGIPVHFVAPPQLWAYRKSSVPGAPQARLRRLRATLEDPSFPRASLQFLFPFEAGPYAPWTGRTCQGHFFPEPAFDPARGTRLLLCPGSRRGVVARNLPLWLANVRAFFGTLEGVDVLVPEFLREEARRLCGTRAQANEPGADDWKGPAILTDRDQAFARAGAAIAFPGTVTLELFLHRIPTRAWAVVDSLTLHLGRKRLRGPHLTLPNVLAGREVLPEWVGTVTDFTRNPPRLPSTIAEWNAPHPGLNATDAVAPVWAAMGSDRGVEEGVKACLEIIPAGL